jgi:hypothetical protein
VGGVVAGQANRAYQYQTSGADANTLEMKG